MLVRATPLILTGLAVAFAFQAGVLNIGAEGQFLVGAACATTIALFFNKAIGPSVILFSLAAGSAAGALWALIAAELRMRFRVLEVISTIMLNFIAIYLIAYLVRGPLQEPTHIYPQTAELPPVARLPLIIPGTRLHAGFAIAVIAGIAGWWILRHTAAGFRLRAAGMNPDAARMAGRINVERTTRNVFLASGSLAGLAGALEVHGVTFALYENLSPGYGYTAIAVALLAALNPLLVVVTGIFFGALETIASALQRDAGIPSTIVSVIEASIVLAVLAIQRVRVRIPNQA
jgi:simple sugar transport system permease protein